jgi:hypothetical protein
VRRLPAPSRTLPGALGRSVLPVPPLGGTPRLPALHDRLPRKGPPNAGPRRRELWNRPPVPPLARQAGDRAPRGARSVVPCRLAPAIGSTPSPLAFATGSGVGPTPFARSRSVVGPPVARWASSRGISSLVDHGSEVRARKTVLGFCPELIRRSGESLAGHPYGRFASDVTPRRRDARLRPTPPRIAPR